MKNKTPTLTQIYNDAGFEYNTVIDKEDAFQLMVIYGEYIREAQELELNALKMELKYIKDRLKSHSEYIEDFAQKVLRESKGIETLIENI
jgi:hypothetical protein